jgi:hypothetical protein
MYSIYIALTIATAQNYFVIPIKAFPSSVSKKSFESA